MQYVCIDATALQLLAEDTVRVLSLLALFLSTARRIDLVGCIPLALVEPESGRVGCVVSSGITITTAFPMDDLPTRHVSMLFAMPLLRPIPSSASMSRRASPNPLAHGESCNS